MRHKFALQTLAQMTAIACALIGNGAALAQSGSGSYVGISVGDASDIGTSLKLYGGARLGQHLGWEAQFTDFGSQSDSFFGSGGRKSAYAVGASAVGLLPFAQNLSALGKLGVHWVQTKTRFSGRSSSDSSTELGLGIGLLWQVSNQIGLRGELENIGGGGGDVLSVGVQMRF